MFIIIHDSCVLSPPQVAYGNTQKSGSSYSCQHGEGECASDVYESCVEYKLAGSIDTMFSASIDAWPFVLCMEEADGNPLKAESCYSSSMSNSTVAWSEIEDCYNNESDDVQAAAAAETALTGHTYVPWVTVDDVLLEQSALLQHAICQAYTGTPPVSCGLGLAKPDGACSKDW